MQARRWRNAGANGCPKQVCGFAGPAWSIASAFCFFAAPPCFASYHFMQIEQVVAGVNGDSSAQAIQLRMRSSSQQHVELAKLIAFDAAGENPIVIIDFASSVAQSAGGSRVLVTSKAMTAYTDPPVEPDFVMSHTIPQSYLEAGSLLFENDDETLLVWRFSWGGASYTGSTTAALTNDDDREFGPPYPDPLPTSGLQAVVFAGGATATSTSNAADYEIVNPGVLTNNAGESFTLIVPNCDDPNGAGEDSDGDGVRDVCDDCPHDDSKLEPGECGCGNPDLDADGNGLTDCVEEMDAGSASPDDHETGSNDNGGSQGTSDDGGGPTDEGSGNDNSNGTPGSQGGSGTGSASAPRPCGPGVGAFGILFVVLISLRLQNDQRRLATRR